MMGRILIVDVGQSGLTVVHYHWWVLTMVTVSSGEEQISGGVDSPGKLSKAEHFALQSY